MTTRPQIVEGDITEQDVDAVVNAANPSLLGGGGVDGAIHRRGGPAIRAACEEIRRARFPRGLPTGEAVATTAGDLPARWVIHTVGPVYSGSEEDPLLLASCHVNALRVADELGATSVAFPAISTGAYGYPMREAAAVALLAVGSIPTSVTDIRFVLVDRFALSVFEEAQRRAEGIVLAAPNDLPSDPSIDAGWASIIARGAGRMLWDWP
jgi:O-acetyl-ADP-ribose deacetylase (regulator of RNase III)